MYRTFNPGYSSSTLDGSTLKQSKQMYRIKLIVGDADDIGHGKTQDVIISSSLSVEDLQKAHKEGLKILGEEYGSLCLDSEFDYITGFQYKTLVKLDNRLEEGIGIVHFDHDSVGIGRKGFAVIYMIVATVGNPKLEWTEEEKVYSINIGGYGLF